MDYKEYKIMDDELIEINKIKNINSIFFDELTTPGDRGTIIVPTLSVTYETNKNLFYSVMDKNFELFLRRVVSCYYDEKDLHQENADDPLFTGHKGIKIDDISRKIIENANILDKKDITSFYENKDSYPESLLFKTDELKSVIDIIRYSISYYADFSNKKIKLSDNYYGNYYFVIDAEVNDKFKQLIIMYNRVNDNRYEISVTNLDDDLRPYNIGIEFSDDRISIVSEYKGVDKRISITNEYKIDEKGATYEDIVLIDGEMKVYQPGKLEKVVLEKNNLINLEYENNLTWYKLPWRAYFGYNHDTLEINENNTMYTNNVTYLDINDNDFTKREYYTKKLRRRHAVTKKEVLFKVDEIRKNTYGYLSDKNFLIETHFKKTNGDGDYQRNFSDRYFYHLAPTNDITKINKKILIPVTNYNVSVREDLLSNENIRNMGGK